MSQKQGEGRPQRLARHFEEGWGHEASLSVHVGSCSSRAVPCRKVTFQRDDGGGCQSGAVAPEARAEMETFRGALLVSILGRDEGDVRRSQALMFAAQWTLVRDVAVRDMDLEPLLSEALPPETPQVTGRRQSIRTPSTFAGTGGPTSRAA